MKSRSSIFSFDTLQGNPLRLLGRPSIVLAALLLLGVELAVRVTIPDGHIPKGGFHNGELRQQVRQLEQLETDVDLMISGSSIAAANYPPVAFDAELERLGVDEFVSFNAGIRGCNWTCIGPGLQKLFLSRAAPDYLLLIVSPHDLHEGGTGVIDRSYEFLESFNQPAYRRVIQNALASVLWLYGFDAEIRSLLTSGRWGFDPARVTERGHVDMGMMPRERFDWDFQIDRDGPIAQALYELVRHATRRGISVLILPVEGDSDTRENFETDDRAEFAAILARLSGHQPVTVITTRNGWFEDRDYIDNLHLRPEAARENARRLARRLIDLGFPWMPLD